jgi:hypothetical protein
VTATELERIAVLSRPMSHCLLRRIRTASPKLHSAPEGPGVVQITGAQPGVAVLLADYSVWVRSWIWASRA